MQQASDKHLEKTPSSKVPPHVRFFQITNVQHAYVILPYVNRTSHSLYDENKLCVSYLQPKFTKVSTECAIG